jgi:hypothetical protein
VVCGAEKAAEEEDGGDKEGGPPDADGWSHLITPAELRIIETTE